MANTLKGTGGRPNAAKNAPSAKDVKKAYKMIANEKVSKGPGKPGVKPRGK